MPTQMLRVFLSSTGKDLDGYRRALMTRLRASDHIIVDGMENFGARDDTPLNFCRDRVGKCDVLVGLIGHYRGWEVEGDEQKRSITEIEFDCATEGTKPRLMYVAPDDFVATAPDEPTAARNRQKKFRTRIRKGRVVGKGFTSPDQLAGDIIVDLMNLWAERLAVPIAAASASTSSQAIAEAVVAAEKSATEGDTRFKQALELLQANKPSEAETIFRIVAEEKAARVRQESEDAAAAFRHLGAIAGLGDPKRAREAYGRAVEFDPEDREARYWHGRLQLQAGNLALAERDLDELLRLSQLTDDVRGTFRACLHLGELLIARGALELARKRLDDACAVADRNLDLSPDDHEWHRDRSEALRRIGEVEISRGSLPAALKTLRDCVSIRNRLAKADPASASGQLDSAIAHDDLGHVLKMLGDLSSSLEDHLQANAIFKRLAESDLANAHWQRHLSVSYERVGDVQSAQGNLPAALAAYRDSFVIRERLWQSDPRNAGWQRELSVSQERIGDVLMAQGNLPAALTAFRDNLAIAERLAEADPRNVVWQRDLSISHNKVGNVLAAQGNLPAALSAYRNGLAIAGRLAQSDFENVHWQIDLLVAHWRLAENGDEPARRWPLIVDTLRKLKAEDKLTAEQTTWLPEAERRLEEVAKKKKK